jgi:DNA polymerase family A
MEKMKPIRTIKDGFQEMVLDFYPILEDASKRGIPIDEEERIKLSIDLGKDKQILYQKIQNQIPDEMRKLHPIEGYIRVPKEVIELTTVYEENAARIKSQTTKQVLDCGTFVSRKSIREVVKREKDKPSKFTGIFEKLRIAQFEVGGELVSRWVWVQDFNPNASKQIIAYMKSKGHKVPVKLDGNETSEAKELERLAISTGDGFYDEIIEYRQISKMLTNDIPNWSPDEETGAVHSQFGFLPASGQINSRHPNSQNANKHKPLGKRFRRIIRARDYRDGRWRGRSEYGRRRVLLEADYSGFHAIMLGREAQSERYINISNCDVHSWFTSYIIHKPVEYPSLFNTDSSAKQKFIEGLRNIKEAYKTIRDTQAKPSILGVGLGLGPRKLHWMNRLRLDKKTNQMIGIKDQRQAQNLQGMLKELLPELFEYQERIKDLAFHQTYLINKWGMIRWFFDVRGEDGERAIAFNVQGNAHGMLRWVLKRLRDGKDKNNISLLNRFHFINTIHDSLIFEPWEDEIDLCARTVKRAMESPCVVLADNKVCPLGLVVKVDVTVGENWADYDEKINPGGMRQWTDSRIVLAA